MYIGFLYEKILQKILVAIAINLIYNDDLMHL